MASKIPLNKVLAAVDKKDREFYDNLTPEEQKSLSSYLMLRYAAAVDNRNPDIVMYYLLSANKRANKHMFSLSKHPKLQWLMVTTISPDIGNVKHTWIKNKPKAASTDSAMKKGLLDLFPAWKDDDIDTLLKIIDKKEYAEYVKDHGIETRKGK